MGNSRYVEVNLTGTLRLADALKQLYVLLPALDGAKHRVSQDEADKLLRAGEGWLAGHPERKLIANRYLVRRKSYVNYALAQLAEPDEVPAEAEPLVTEVPEQPQPLAVQRQGSVLAALRAAGAKRVLDLGCGGGALLGALMRDSSFTEIVGLDVSVGALNTAERRLKLDQLPEQARARITLRQSALTYADPPLSGYDAAVLMEVIEHVDQARLPALEHAAFSVARPRTVLVTTPNSEYTCASSSCRKALSDTATTGSNGPARSSASGPVASQTSTATKCANCPSEEPETGPPTQLAVFTTREEASA
jgi:3' terminal RNA ribose 2'-O-methyltransferase Hen1